MLGGGPIGLGSPGSLERVVAFVGAGLVVGAVMAGALVLPSVVAGGVEGGGG